MVSGRLQTQPKICPTAELQRPAWAWAWRSTYSLGLGLGVDKLVAEVIVLGAILAGAVDDDLLVVVRQLVDDVFELLVELELVVGRYALGVDGGSGVWLAPLCLVLGHASRPALAPIRRSQGRRHDVEEAGRGAGRTTNPD